jgi:hypothetical protein
MKLHGWPQAHPGALNAARAWQAIGRAAPTARQGVEVGAQDGAHLTLREEMKRNHRGGRAVAGFERRASVPLAVQLPSALSGSQGDQLPPALVSPLDKKH